MTRNVPHCRFTFLRIVVKLYLTQGVSERVGEKNLPLFFYALKSSSKPLRFIKMHFTGFKRLRIADSRKKQVKQA